MVDIIKELNKYLASATPEQLQNDLDAIKEYNNIGCTVEEYMQQYCSNEDAYYICDNLNFANAA